MNYELRRLVCDYNDTHIEVHSNLHFEMIPRTLMYFKVCVKDKLSLGKITFHHTSKTDLTVFYDQNVKEPSEKLHFKMFTNPKSFPLLFESGFEFYTSDYVYFSLYS